METEPVAYIVGDSTVRIDDVIGVLSDDHRAYTYRITRDGITTVYRADVCLFDIIRMSDQQLAEYLAHRSRRRIKLFSYPS